MVMNDGRFLSWYGSNCNFVLQDVKKYVEGRLFLLPRSRVRWDCSQPYMTVLELERSRLLLCGTVHYVVPDCVAVADM